MKKEDSRTVIIKTKNGSLQEITRKMLIYKLKKFDISTDIMIHNTDGVWRPISSTRGFRTLCLHIKSGSNEHAEAKASEKNENTPNNSPKLDNPLESFAEINNENHRTLQHTQGKIKNLTPAIANDTFLDANKAPPNNFNQNKLSQIGKRKNYIIPHIESENETYEQNITKPNPSKYIAFFCLIITLISPAYWIAIDKIIVNDEFAETTPKEEATLYISSKPILGNLGKRTETKKSWEICKKKFNQDLLDYKNSADQ